MIFIVSVSSSSQHVHCASHLGRKYSLNSGPFFALEQCLVPLLNLNSTTATVSKQQVLASAYLAAALLLIFGFSYKIVTI